MYSRLLWAPLLLAGCIRSTAEVPAPGEGAFLTGSVVETNLKEGGFQPALGAIVRVQGTSTTRPVDERGFFQLERLPLGRLVLEIERPAGPTLPAAALILDGVSAKVDGQIIDLGEIRLLGTGSLGGRVYAHTDPLTPIGGALAVVTRTAFKGISDEGGGYRVPSLPQGTFDLVVFAAGYAPGRVTGVGVSANLDSSVRDLVLETSTGSISVAIQGSARLAGTEDASGIAVELRDEVDPSQRRRATTDAAGNFGLTVPLGVYRARFSHDGYRSVELPGVAVLEEGVLGLLPVVLDPAVSGDLDGDGQPDGVDLDRDNDGCPDAADAFPDDPFACGDNDGDGLPDQLDPDDDNDGLSDAEEQSLGVDGFFTDPLRPDTDGDGFPDREDLCPTTASALNQASACSGPEELQPIPTITTSTPSQGGPGTTIVIQGTNFLPSLAANRVYFGGSGPTAPTRVSSNRLEVQVPNDATSGTITLTTGVRSVDAPGSFCFVPRPNLSLLEPDHARPTATLRVFGQQLSVPACRVPAGSALRARFVGSTGNPLFALPVGPTFTTQIGGQTYQTFEVAIPPGTVSGPVTVETDDGPGGGSATLTIDNLPTITQLVPARPIPGAPLTIFGSGFGTADVNGPPLSVEFPGVAPVTPITQTGSALRVTVPMTASDGTLIVHHPAGDATTPLVLEAARAVIGPSPSIALAGSTIAILGRDLSTATQVRFGAIPATISGAPTDGSITVVVPSGAEPGPPEVTFADASTLSSQTSFRRVDLTSFTNSGMGTVIGLGAGLGNDLYLMSSGLVRRIDSVTLTQTGVDQPHGFGATFLRVQASPSGQRMVIVGTQVWVVSLPDFGIVGSCADRTIPVSTNIDPQLEFDPFDQAAYLPSPRISGVNHLQEVLRIDLVTGNCDLLDVSGAAAGNVLGVAWSTPGALLVLNSSLGFGTLDVEPTSPTYGQYLVAPPSGAVFAPGAFSNISAMYGSDRGGRVWLLQSGMLKEATPPSATLGRTVGFTPPTVATLSADRRYALAGSDLLDLENGAIAVQINIANAGSTIQGAKSTAHATDLVFYGIGSQSNLVIRAEIKE